MIFPISVTSFRDLRHGVGLQAAVSTRRPGAKWLRRRPSVNKPASHRQLGIARRQVVCQLSGAQSGLLARPRDRGSFLASKASYGLGCAIAMVDTEGPCDMLENREKGSKFREVVGLPVPPSSAQMRRVEKLRPGPHRTIGHAPSPHRQQGAARTWAVATRYAGVSGTLRASRSIGAGAKSSLPAHLVHPDIMLRNAFACGRSVLRSMEPSSERVRHALCSTCLRRSVPPGGGGW